MKKKEVLHAITKTLSSVILMRACLQGRSYHLHLALNSLKTKPNFRKACSLYPLDSVTLRTLWYLLNSKLSLSIKYLGSQVKLPLAYLIQTITSPITTYQTESISTSLSYQYQSCIAQLTSTAFVARNNKQPMPHHVETGHPSRSISSKTKSGSQDTSLQSPNFSTKPSYSPCAVTAESH